MFLDLLVEKCCITPDQCKKSSAKRQNQEYERGARTRKGISESISRQ